MALVAVEGEEARGRNPLGWLRGIELLSRRGLTGRWGVVAVGAVAACRGWRRVAGWSGGSGWSCRVVVVVGVVGVGA